MDLFIEILVCVLAGIGAGVGTGFAGLSAAAFITPLLIGFLNVPMYEAVGIALLSDVLASAVSAFTYGRNKKIDFKNSIPLFVSVLVFAVIGSIVSYFISVNTTGNIVMSLWTIIGSLYMGIRLMVKPQTEKKDISQSKFSPLAREIIFGCFIGFICGFQGCGGGMMMLFTLTLIMCYEFKTAVGTSVLIMTFTALIGAGTHFAANGIPDWKMLVICVAATFVAARVSAVIANKISSKTCNFVTGILLCISSGVSLVMNIISLVNAAQ